MMLVGSRVIAGYSQPMATSPLSTVLLLTGFWSAWPCGGVY